MPAGARSAWLRDVCGDDETLRLEVESLLVHEQSAERILDGLAGAAAVEVVGEPASLVGRRVGMYDIVSRLGEGGMGEVYRARDTQLGRDVAVKVLPPAFVGDRERLARFEREARVLAALNHPHIGAIYGVEPIDESRALILELVEGDTLASRIAQGAGRRGIPIAEALRIASQIAEALETAHEKGIVHRDLKPANIKITPGGVVKVLDFGLAKPGGPTGLPAPDLSNSPTFTLSGTRDGMLLGTAAYMSPEQARGQSVDKRTDVWAFGCVLFEMLSGRRGFPGETVTDTLAAVVNGEPDWVALPKATPSHVRRLLERCLRKDPKQRLHDIADARLDLEDQSSTPLPLEPALKQRARLSSPTTIVTALLLVAVAAIALWRIQTSESSANAPATARTGLALPLGTTIDHDGGLAISPDGQTLAFVASSRDGSRLLHIRRLGEWEFHSFPGTERAMNPFFSPDGQWVAFGQEEGEGVKKVPVRGGPPLLICATKRGYFGGGAWQSDGQIVFATWPDVALWRVSADGGTPELLKRTSEGNAIWYLRPEPLPRSRAVLFTEWRQGQTSILALVPGETEPRTIVRSGAYPRYLPNGHLVYVSQGHLLASSFNLDRLEVRGGATVVIDDLTEDMLKADYDVSATGTLAYLPARFSLATLVWKDRRGATTPLGLNPRRYESPTLAPDGRRLAVTVHEGPARNVWVGSVDREPLTRLTLGNNDSTGPWTPDGRRLIVNAGREGRFNIFWTATDGSGSVERLTDSADAKRATSVAPGGDLVLFNSAGVWELSIAQKQSRQIMSQGYGNAVFSPDGRWIAYHSPDSGQMEVYVQRYPVPGPKTQVSVGGGVLPHWNPNGRELFFKSGTALMAVPVLDTEPFRVGEPVRLFAHTEYDYAVSQDGQRFLIVERADAGGVPAQLNLVQHWFEELRARVPTK